MRRAIQSLIRIRSACHTAPASPAPRLSIRPRSTPLYRLSGSLSTKSSSSVSASGRGARMRALTRRLAAAVIGAMLIAIAHVGPLWAQSAPLPAPVILIVDLQQILQDAKAAKGVQAIIN